MHLRNAVLAGGLGMLLVGAPAQAITISNPSFEQVVLGPPFHSSNTADVPGWTRSGASGDAALWAVGYSDGGGNITVAGAGSQFTTMGGGFSTSGSTSWSQSLAGFTVGTSYRLDFMMAAEGPFAGSQSVTAEVGTAASQTFTEAGALGNYWKDWKNESMTFVANATSMELKFSSTTRYDVGLDNVRITEVSAPIPEPDTYAMLLAGLGALGFIARRRRQDTR